MALKNLKKYFFILFSLGLIIFIIVGWRYQTKGFRPHKIFGQIPFKDFEIKTSEEDENEALSILNKKFKYLSQGSQAYVFEAEDKSYVLKLIALNKYKEPFRRTLLSHLGLFKEYRKERVMNRERNFKAALASYKFVYENLKTETGTVYVHFKKNEKFTKKIKIEDRMGLCYEIDPNKVLFIIQKQASKIIKPYLLQCVQNNSFPEIKKTIENYLELADAVLKKGFINRDSCVKNSGICADGFIEIDIGRFQKIRNPAENYVSYLQKYTRLYRKFLESNIPSMVEYFDNKTAKLREKNGLP